VTIMSTGAKRSSEPVTTRTEIETQKPTTHRFTSRRAVQPALLLRQGPPTAVEDHRRHLGGHGEQQQLVRCRPLRRLLGQRQLDRLLGTPEGDRDACRGSSGPGAW
jgi:hypothetical protein